MKRLLCTVVTIISSFTMYGYTAADIFSYDIPITWLGLDFSHMQFIGQASQMQGTNQITSDVILNKYVPAWNDLFIHEKDKYHVAKSVHRREVEYAIEITGNVNKRITRSFYTTSEPLTENTIAKLVSSYDFKNHDGIGLVFFIENFNKEKEEATMWVTFVDMGTHKLLLTKQLTVIAHGGIGFRNYWAWTFYRVLEDMNHYWRKWEHEYEN